MRPVSIPGERTHTMNEHTMLYRQEGAAEHLFRLSLLARDGGYVVNAASGIRGEKLQIDAMTPTAVDYGTARRIYTDLLNEKTGEGYLLESRSYPQERLHVSRQQHGLRPTRPLVIPMGRAGRLISDRDWWLQESYSGQHLLIRKTRDAVEGIDENGLTVSLPETVVLAASKIAFRWVLEGVCSGDRFTVFDIPEFELLDFRSMAYSVRMAAIRELLYQPHGQFQIAETAVGISAKAELLQRLRAGEKEGIVLKKANGVTRRGGLTVDGHALQCAFPGNRAMSVAPSAASPINSPPVDRRQSFDVVPPRSERKLK